MWSQPVNIFTREVRNSREAPQLPISPDGPAVSRIKGESRMISGRSLPATDLGHRSIDTMSPPSYLPALIFCSRGLLKHVVVVKNWAFLARRPWMGVSLVSARRGRVWQFCKGSPPSVREANFLLLSAYCMAQTNSPLGTPPPKEGKIWHIFVPTEVVE